MTIYLLFATIIVAAGEVVDRHLQHYNNITKVFKMADLILSDKLEKINAIIEKAKTAKNTYKVKITENNKALILSKAALKALNENGVELEKVYISYNKSPILFKTIEKILSDNSELFTDISE